MTISQQLTLVMQSLDNRVENPMQIPDWVSTSHADPRWRRQEAMRLINETTFSNAVVQAGHPDVSGFRGRWAFVLEITPEDLDAAGRRSPVVCQARFKDVQSRSDMDEVADAIAEFCLDHQRAPLSDAVRIAATEMIALLRQPPSSRLDPLGLRGLLRGLSGPR